MNRQASNSSGLGSKGTGAEVPQQKVQQQPQLSQADSEFKCISSLDKDEEMYWKDQAAFARRRSCNYSGRMDDDNTKAALAKLG